MQAITGGGGWPMSVFLTPTLEPIVGASTSLGCIEADVAFTHDKFLLSPITDDLQLPDSAFKSLFQDH